MSALEPDRLVGEEARKAHPRRVGDGFIDRYLSGAAILDIGYRGYRADVVPITPQATGVELDYPGYDGITLPFDDGSQDAVFASHCLEHIKDFRTSIRDWFRVLRTGGFLIVMVPHQFLYEKRMDLPSRYNRDHKRFYTPASLMAEIETSLRPNTYRLRHLVDNDMDFDYTIPPDQHSGGSYEIELVVEKIQAPAWQLVDPHLPSSELVPDTRIVGPAHGGSPAIRTIPTSGDAVAVYDFGTRPPSRPRILALKLDHLGDFIIGLPSLQRLRDAFPTAHIRLVVGGWNREAAGASHLVDDVIGYDYFPQYSLDWDGAPHEPVAKFRALTAGRYDIAIDLRVDEDTRGLLREVDAAIRCGIGSGARHPYLDVALPPEHAVRAHSPQNESSSVIAVDRFKSHMPFRHAFYQQTDFRPVPGHLVYGPDIALPVGRFKIVFGVQLTGWTLGLGKTAVTFDIARDGSEIVALKRLRGAELRALDGVELSFTNEDIAAHYEFRIHIAGKPLHARLRFAGVHIEPCDGVPMARFQRAELHIGEKLSQLVQLVSDRASLLYGQAGPPQRNPAPGACTRQIAIAPFSNSDLRDWPFEHYVRLVRLLIEGLDCRITLLGSKPQAEQLDRLVHQAGGGVRIRNLGGQTSWSDIPDRLREADLVICNNSGIAHLAAASGVLTLAIYSASHQPQEWGPRGERSHALMTVVPCSPCGHDRLVDCPYEHRCMRGLAPDTVFDEARRLLAGPGIESEAALVTASQAIPSDTAGMTQS